MTKYLVVQMPLSEPANTSSTTVHALNMSDALVVSPYIVTEDDYLHLVEHSESFACTHSGHVTYYVHKLEAPQS